MKRTSLSVALLMANAQALAYTVDHQTTPIRLIKAAEMVLRGEGFEIPYSSPAGGQLNTRPKSISFAPDEVDCGKKFGFSYAKDKRTQIQAAYTINAESSILSIASSLTGRLIAGSGAPDVELSCISLGQLEKSLASKITEAAYNLPADVDIKQSDRIELSTTTETAATAPEAKATDQEKPLIANPKTVDQAVAIINTTLNIEEIALHDAVTLRLDYENKTTKRIIGVSVRVIIKNAFGKETLNAKLDDEISIPAGAMKGNVDPWYWADNQFIQGQPFDRMAPSVQNDTAKVSTKILKVIFEDGTSLTSPIQQNKKN